MACARPLLWLLWLALPGAAASGGPLSGVPSDDGAGWRALFDGATLDGWQRSGFAGSGAVSVAEGRLHLEFGQPLTGVTYTGGLPAGDYEIEVEAARLAGSDFFLGLTFPVGDESATLVLGGWGGALVGLSCIDGKDAAENETTCYRRFEKGRLYRVQVRVTAASILALLDGAPLFEVARGGRRFTVRPEVAASAPLGLAAFNTRAAIAAIRLRGLPVPQEPPEAPQPPQPMDPGEPMELAGDGEALPEALRGLGLAAGPSFSRADADWTAPARVVVAFAAAEPWQKRLAAAAPGVELVYAADARAAAAAAVDADAVIGACTAEIVAAGARLRWIQVGSAGVERYLAIDELLARDIVLTNGKRLAGVPIAEHALAMVLALSRGLRVTIPMQAEGAWRGGGRRLDEAEPFELKGRTLLVLGLGGIGEEVARRASAFAMRVLATRRSSRERPPFVDRVGLPDELHELAAAADVVVNCLPHTADTDGLLSTEFFRALKPGAIVINVGRGRTLDTAALLEALESGRVRAAGLDVTDPEPLPADHPLWRMENVLITPHVAARSDGQAERRMWLYVENLRRFAAGLPLLNVVDKKAGY